MIKTKKMLSLLFIVIFIMSLSTSAFAGTSENKAFMEANNIEVIDGYIISLDGDILDVEELAHENDVDPDELLTAILAGPDADGRYSPFANIKQLGNMSLEEKIARTKATSIENENFGKRSTYPTNANKAVDAIVDIQYRASLPINLDNMPNKTVASANDSLDISMTLSKKSDWPNDWVDAESVGTIVINGKENHFAASGVLLLYENNVAIGALSGFLNNSLDLNDTITLSMHYDIDNNVMYVPTSIGYFGEDCVPFDLDFGKDISVNISNAVIAGMERDNKQTEIDNRIMGVSKMVCMLLVCPAIDCISNRIIYLNPFMPE